MISVNHKAYNTVKLLKGRAGRIPFNELKNTKLHSRLAEAYSRTNGTAKKAKRKPRKRKELSQIRAETLHFHKSTVVGHYSRHRREILRLQSVN